MNNKKEDKSALTELIKDLYIEEEYSDGGVKNYPLVNEDLVEPVVDYLMENDVGIIRDETN